MVSNPKPTEHDESQSVTREPRRQSDDALPKFVAAFGAPMSLGTLRSSTKIIIAMATRRQLFQRVLW